VNGSLQNGRRMSCTIFAWSSDWRQVIRSVRPHLCMHLTCSQHAEIISPIQRNNKESSISSAISKNEKYGGLLQSYRVYKISGNDRPKTIQDRNIFTTSESDDTIPQLSQTGNSRRHLCLIGEGCQTINNTPALAGGYSSGIKDGHSLSTETVY